MSPLKGWGERRKARDAARAEREKAREEAEREANQLARSARGPIQSHTEKTIIPSLAELENHHRAVLAEIALFEREPGVSRHDSAIGDIRMLGIWAERHPQEQLKKEAARLHGLSLILVGARDLRTGHEKLKQPGIQRLNEGLTALTRLGLSDVQITEAVSAMQNQLEAIAKSKGVRLPSGHRFQLLKTGKGWQIR